MVAARAAVVLREERAEAVELQAPEKAATVALSR
jgi:hypothetical protein